MPPSPSRKCCRLVERSVHRKCRKSFESSSSLRVDRRNEASLVREHAYRFAIGETHLQLHLIPIPTINENLRQHAGHIHQQRERVERRSLSHLIQIGAYHHHAHCELHGDSLSELAVQPVRVSVRKQERRSTTISIASTALTAQRRA